MKKFSIVILFFIGLLNHNLFAQPAVNSKGRVIDSAGNVWVGATKLGSISRDSIVKNAQGKKIAFVKSGGILVDANGKTLGRMGKDGTTYYNYEGTPVFYVKDNSDNETCDILDSKGKVIGNVHNNFKPIVCTMYCYSNKMNHKTHRKIKK